MSGLHITNGDSAADTLRAFLAAPVVVTADVLHDGPAPDVDDDAWYELRARHLAQGDAAAMESTRRGLAAGDRLIAGSDGELVLWFEHDLFDQLLLIRTLDLIGRPRNGRAPASAGPRVRSTTLICIDRFPGVNRFIGLGQLDARQLASLVDTRQLVTDEQFSLASRAWRAFRAGDPTALARLAAAPEETAALPFLGDALLRFLAEYPSAAHGLSRTAANILDALADGPREAGALFAATQGQEREARPFMGDWSFFDTLRALARARVPLVTIMSGDEARDLRGRAIALTDAGRDVHARRRDAVRLNGIDQWRGGVHLTGARDAPWRWDADRERLVSLV